MTDTPLTIAEQVCPFCGGEGKLTSFGVGCYKCSVFFNINGDTIDDIAAWNTRATMRAEAAEEDGVIREIKWHVSQEKALDIVAALRSAGYRIVRTPKQAERP